MITDTNIPSPEDFGFTEILDDTLPYKIVGYARGVCPDAANPYGYAPPVGWMITSCTKMPPGTHGVRSGEPVILVYCEPKPATMNIPPADYEQSIIYVRPTNGKVVEGKVYSIPNQNAFYIEQSDYKRYSISGTSLETLKYVDGEDVVASIKLTSIYQDIVGVDQWGTTAELLDIRRVGEPETQSEIEINTNTLEKERNDPWTLATIALGVVGIAMGVHYLFDTR